MIIKRCIYFSVGSSTNRNSVICLRISDPGDDSHAHRRRTLTERTYARRPSPDDEHLAGAVDITCRPQLIVYYHHTIVALIIGRNCGHFEEISRNLFEFSGSKHGFQVRWCGVLSPCPQVVCFASGTFVQSPFFTGLLAAYSSSRPKLDLIVPIEHHFSASCASL